MNTVQQPQLDLSLSNGNCPAHTWRLAVWKGLIPDKPLCFECIVNRDHFNVDDGPFKREWINTVGQDGNKPPVAIKKEAPKVNPSPQVKQEKQSSQKQEKKQEKKPEKPKDTETKEAEPNKTEQTKEPSISYSNATLYYLALSEKRVPVTSRTPLPSVTPPVVSMPPSQPSVSKEEPKKPTPQVEVKPKTDDDFDLFGDVDEDEKHEAEIIRIAKEAEDKKKASGKERPIAKSLIVIDVKPWEDTTDLKLMEEGVRAIKMDGLEWKASKLVPMVFNIWKLQISCHVVDDLVSTDDVQESIQELTDFVQSTDIVMFSKL